LALSRNQAAAARLMTKRSAKVWWEKLARNLVSKAKRPACRLGWPKQHVGYVRIGGTGARSRHGGHAHGVSRPAVATQCSTPKVVFTLRNSNARCASQARSPGRWRTGVVRRQRRVELTGDERCSGVVVDGASSRVLVHERVMSNGQRL
jgi:hypothetical protein